jgi:hypothetical protein
MLQAVGRRWSKTHELRPSTLSIAVNGHIIAFHDVRAEHSKLSARIERPEDAKFVEVFSEQDVRFALISIAEHPPEGSHVLTQRAELSDDRWLELSLSFDGLGLNGQVTYFDPVLATQVVEEDPEESPAWQSKPEVQAAPNRFSLRALYAAFFRMLAVMTPSSAFAWVLTLALLFGGAGYLAYWHKTRPTEAMKILNESVKAETATLQDQTEHQVLRVEELSSKGELLEQGTVDLWRDGNGDRYLRRLYDSQDRMLAAEWRNTSGEHTSRRNPGSKSGHEGNHPLVMHEFWDQDLSAHAFSTLAGHDLRMHAVEEGFELTTDSPIESHGQLVSATLVLNRQLEPVRATLRVRSGSSLHELRFVQVGYERRRRASVPDTMFDPGSYSGVRDLHPLGIHPPHLSVAGEDASLLAELQIGVLYQLNRLGADIGEPIEVKRTDDERIQVSGAVADDALKQRIASQLKALPNHQLLDVELFSSHEMPMHGSRAAQTLPSGVYEINQSKSAADAMLRRYFEAKGVSGERLDSAVVGFSHDALEHAQRALQHAYALDRLGRALSVTERGSIRLSSQQKWTEMLHQHASELEQQLMAMRDQLGELSPSATALPDATGETVLIANPLEFSQAAGRLLQSVQELNSQVSNTFASGTSGQAQPEQGDSVSAIVKAIPLQQAREIRSFSMKLSSSTTPGSIQRPNNGDTQSIPGISQ